MDLVLGGELDPHSPASVRRQEATKLLQCQLVIVDLDHRLTFHVIVNQAAEDPAARGPLMALGLVLDLRGAQGQFHGDMLVLRREHGLRPEHVVVQRQDRFVGHR